MKIIVASNNPVKVNACRKAFEQQFPGADLDIVSAEAESGVDDQPFSDEDTRHGAINRAHNASESSPDADYWVGLEGGVDTFNGQLMAFAWMAVLGKDGRTGTARTVTLPLPPAVKKLVEEGLELGDANDIVFSTVNSKHEGGAFGLLTDGRYTREGVYTETLVIALVPFVNGLYR
ncbi:MAG: inosine/xanthosine triphosphatase [Xanthomonadales bacterium]|jgi:inosine/xanthosine triphosphatase|nr:inosine/xanthosine triphosphatase [Xanthomonadales bacterium]